jgi:hypothetical protein
MTQNTKLTVTLAITVALAALIELHATGINGPSYWTWSWRVLNPWQVYPLTLLAAVPVFLAQAVYRESRARTLAAILLLMVGMFASELAWRAAEKTPQVPDVVQFVVKSTVESGYFRQAWELFVRDGMSVQEYLRHYPDLMPKFYMHPSVRPPAAILFYLPFLRIWNNVDDAAYAAGIALGVLATFGLPATYALLRVLTGNASAAFAAASFLALCPGMIGFFPGFDQVYPVFTALLVIPWVWGLRHNRPAWSAAFGLILALCCLQTHGILMLGVFLGAWSVAWAIYNRNMNGWRRLALATCIALASLVAFYTLFWLATDFDPIRTIRVTLLNQRKILDELKGSWQRPWPLTVPWDIYDVILGTGWISVWLMICYFVSARKTASHQAPPCTDKSAATPANGATAPFREIPQPLLCVLCLLQPIAIAVLHVLPGETARLYAFMFPLVLVPVGLELAHWPRNHRLVIYACVWLLGAAVLRNMLFFWTLYYYLYQSGAVHP